MFQDTTLKHFINAVFEISSSRFNDARKLRRRLLNLSKKRCGTVSRNQHHIISILPCVIFVKKLLKRSKNSKKSVITFLERLFSKNADYGDVSATRIDRYPPSTFIRIISHDEADHLLQTHG